MSAAEKLKQSGLPAGELKGVVAATEFITSKDEVVVVGYIGVNHIGQ